MLREGVFRPGEHLPVNALADRLGVGVTPIRDALTRLRGEGWVVARARAGFFALTPTEVDLLDRYEHAALILDHALGAGRQRLDASALPELGVPPDAGHLFAAMTTLLSAIAGLSGNAVMVAAIADFLDRSHGVRSIDLETRERVERAAASYHEIRGALLREDRPAARAGVQALLADQRHNMRALVTEALARPHRLGLDRS